VATESGPRYVRIRETLRVGNVTDSPFDAIHRVVRTLGDRS
jgi:hypothetical protein